MNYFLHPLSIRAMRLFLGLLLLHMAWELSHDLPAILELQVHPIAVHDSALEKFALPENVAGCLFSLLIYLGLPLVGGLLCAGIRPRLTSLAALVIILILQHYMLLFLQGGDTLLRLLLFWSIFLPNTASKMEKHSFTLSEKMVCGAFTLQICCVYWFAAALKTDPLWTKNGNALLYALNIEHFTTPLGLYFRQFPGCLQALTFATRYFEFLGPFLLFIPFHQARFRMLAVILFIAFHLIGMQSLLRVGLFPWVCATAWITFLPDFCWQWLRTTFPRLASYLPDSSPQSKKRDKKVPLPSPHVADYATALFIAICCCDSLAWNVASLQQETGTRWMWQHDKFGVTLGLSQQWNMYAPRPRTIHGWLIVPAELADGTQVDLFIGKPVSQDKPGDIGAYMGDDLWRRYLSNLFDEQNPETLRLYANYVTRHWNDRHAPGQQVKSVTIIFMRQDTEQMDVPPQQDVLYFSL